MHGMVGGSNVLSQGGTLVRTDDNHVVFPLYTILKAFMGVACWRETKQTTQVLLLRLFPFLLLLFFW
jgi:hypothetical protein